MKVKVKITETTVKYVEVDVDSLLEREIQAAVSYLSSDGQIDWDNFDEYEQKLEVVGEVKDDE